MRSSGRHEPLVIAAAAFVGANVLHTLDHLRQGIGGLSPAILVAGTTLTLLALVALAMAVKRHPRAPAFCAVVGLSGAMGIAASHLAPHWSSLSDPYPDLSVDALSWAVMLFEIAAALALGMVAVRALMRQPQHA